MAELTLEQWKERALIAEALLEERNAECENLKAKLETQGGDLKVGDKFTIDGIDGEFQIKDRGERKREQFRQMYGGGLLNSGDDPHFWEKWRDEFKEQAPPWYDYQERFIQEFIREQVPRAPSPADRFDVVASVHEYNGELRLAVSCRGYPGHRNINIPRGEWMTRDPIDLSRMVARDFGAHWQLDGRNTEALAMKLHDTIKGVRRGKR